jgi:hypothetical protein
VKHYITGSGMPGCLYDNGPNYADTLQDAIDGLVWLFAETGNEGDSELAALMREGLAEGGSFYFPDPHAAGAVYCEISECDCDDPSEHMGDE